MALCGARVLRAAERIEAAECLASYLSQARMQGSVAYACGEV